ncbi:MAG TPA: pantoate--beta-alanine ligase, partial [Nitrolancea sp.]|nr:pantoate--beta-alanine ligase [Nitrolancea sp.]
RRGVAESMQVVETIKDLHEWREGISGTVGLVPTMGYLHDGHLALVRRAREENDQVAVSIFVNPRQFGPNEDFARYPRDTTRDLSLLRDAAVDCVFLPSVDEIYPPGFSTTVDVEGLGRRLEGLSRPGHFRGVATVVARLLNLVRPTRAYFGQKDAQQVAVVRRMTADLALPTEIIAVPTVRDADGLALSSRNIFLSIDERTAALSLWRALARAEDAFTAGERKAEVLREIVCLELELQPLVQIDYVSVADSASFEELDLVDRPATIALAVWLGRTRLIDNVALES